MCDRIVRHLGLVSTTDHEARICMIDAVEFRHPPSDLFFSFADVVYYFRGNRKTHLQADFTRMKDELQSECSEYLVDWHHADDPIRAQIHNVMHREYHPSSEIFIDSDLDAPLAWLTTKRHHITLQIIHSVLRTTDQLLFLQGLARTGKTFTTKALIAAGKAPFTVQAGN
jgi:hypothetical protein